MRAAWRMMTSALMKAAAARAYAEAVSVFLALALDKAASYWSSICTWDINKEKIAQVFGRQAIPMAWDYAEDNPCSSSTGNFNSGIACALKVLASLPAKGFGAAI